MDTASLPLDVIEAARERYFLSLEIRAQEGNPYARAVLDGLKREAQDADPAPPEWR